jgi:hypothetical protein
MSFKLYSAKFSCTQRGILTLGYDGDDSNITVYAINDITGIPVVFTKVSKGVFKATNSTIGFLVKGFYFVYVANPEEEQREDAWYQCACKPPIVPNRTITETINPDTGCTDLVISFSNLEVINLDLYTVYTTTRRLDYDHISSWKVGTYTGSDLQGLGFVYRNCVEIYDISIVDNNTGCVIYKITDILKSYRNTDLSVTYSPLTGIRYTIPSWATLVNPDLPPEGTKLPSGKYCFNASGDCLCSQACIKVINSEETDDNIDYGCKLVEGVDFKKTIFNRSGKRYIQIENIKESDSIYVKSILSTDNPYNSIKEGGGVLITAGNQYPVEIKRKTFKTTTCVLIYTKGTDTNCYAVVCDNSLPIVEKTDSPLIPEKHNCTICATEGDHSKLISIKNPETNGPILANILGIGDNIFIDSGEIYTAQLPVDSANLQIEHRSYYNQASTYKRTYNIATIKKTQVGLDYVVQIDDDVYFTNV